MPVTTTSPTITAVPALGITGFARFAPAGLLLLLATLAACGPSHVVSLVGTDPDRGDARGPTDTPRADAGPSADAGPDSPDDAPALTDVAPAGEGPPDGGAADAVPTAADAAIGGGDTGAADVSAADAFQVADVARADGQPDATPDSELDRPGPWMMVSHAPAGPVTDLTTAGAVDWIHFGYQGASRRNRKAGVTARLSMTTIGDVQIYSYDDRPVRFSWRDGAPDTQVTATPDGISVGEEVSGGFEIRVLNTGTRPATVRLHVGAWNARGRLTARLGDGPPYTDTSLTAAAPGQDRVYTIVYRPGPASAPQSVAPLVLRWTLDAIGATYGNVTIQAVTLTE
jgi:hypothetical protein